MVVANCIFEVEFYVNNYDFGVQREYNERVEDRIKLNIEQIGFNRKTRNTFKKKTAAWCECTL